MRLLLVVACIALLVPGAGAQDLEIRATLTPVSKVDGSQTRFLEGRLKSFTRLDFGVEEIESVLSTSPATLVLELPMAGGSERISLRRSRILGAGVSPVAGTGLGDRTLDGYRFEVYRSDNLGSLITFSETGVAGTIETADGRLALRGLRNEDGFADADHVLYRDGAEIGAGTLKCGVGDGHDHSSALMADVRSMSSLDGYSASSDSLVIQLALESDFDTFQAFGSSATAVIDHMLLASAEASAILERDLSIRLEVSYSRVWETADDPYTSGELWILIEELTEHWIENMAHVDRGLVHMLTARDISSSQGVVGYAKLEFDRSYICDTNYGYGVTGTSTGAVPTFTMTHELGHNFGAAHTNEEGFWSGGPFQTCDGSTSLMASCGARELAFDPRVVAHIRQRAEESHCVASSPLVPTAAADSLALAALFQDAGGSSWTRADEWMTGPVGSWEGVAQREGRVVALVLPTNGMVGPLPSGFGDLTELRRIRFDNWVGDTSGRNAISGSLPEGMSDMSGLRYVNLNYNALTGPLPSGFGNLTQLETFAATGNQLSGELPANLDQLTRMRYLILSENQISGAIPAELGSLTSLEELRLRTNRFTGSIPPELGQLANISRLELLQNQLTGEIPAELGALHVNKIDLQDNQLFGSIPPELGQIAELRDVYLNSNQLSGPIPPELGQLPLLRTLYLSRNELTGGIPAELGQASNLSLLALDNNQLSGEVPAELGSLGNLAFLILSFNNLAGDIPASFAQLTRVSNLQLRENHFTGLPDLSALPLSTFMVEGNLLTFEDLEPHAGLVSSLGSQFVYAPQDSVGSRTEMAVDRGGSVTLSGSVGGTGNAYSWYQGAARDSAIGTDASLTLTGFGDADEGEYFLEVTNPGFPDLTVRLRPWVLTVALGPNTEPTVAGTVSDQQILIGDALAEIDLSGLFSDPDGDALTFSAGTSDSLVVRTAIVDATLSLEAVGVGSATVTVVANDSRRGTAEVAFEVSVPGAVAVEDMPLPTETVLLAPFPNPLEGSGTIAFELAEATRVQIMVFDALGREATALTNQEMPPGRHSVRWNTAGLTSGVYFVRMVTQGRVQAQSVVLR